MNTIKINDGINLHIINSDKFKTATIGILIRRPLEKKEVTFNACIPNVLKHGSMKYDTIKKIYEQTENMYGAIFDALILKKGEEQILEFYFEVLNKDNLVVEGLNFLSEIILNPLVKKEAFDNEYVECEKLNIEKLIKGKINNKKEYAKIRCLEEMCKNEPFGIYGDGYAEDLDKINNRNLYEHYKTILKNSPIEFIIIGDVNSEDVENTIKQSFKFERENILQLSTPDLNYNKSEPSKIDEQLDVAQGKLCIGLRTNVNQKGKEFYNLLVANEILGGNANSKLFTNVREKESLCYYVNSFVYRFKTIIFIQSGVDVKNFDKAVELINKEIENIKNGNITDEEFQSAIKSLLKRIDGIKDYPSATMDFYITQYMLNDNNTIKDCLDIISNVTKDDVINSFKDIYTDTIYFLKNNDGQKK